MLGINHRLGGENNNNNTDKNIVPFLQKKETCEKNSVGDTRCGCTTHDTTTYRLDH